MRCPLGGEALASRPVGVGSGVATSGRRFRRHDRKEDTLRHRTRREKEVPAFRPTEVSLRYRARREVRVRHHVVLPEERLWLQARQEEYLAARPVRRSCGVVLSGRRRGSGVAPGVRRLWRRVVQREESLRHRARREETKQRLRARRREQTGQWSRTCQPGWRHAPIGGKRHPSWRLSPRPWMQ